MKIYKRDKDRKPDKIKTDIETTDRILRKDIYEIIKQYEGKLRAEAEEGLKAFLEGLDEKVYAKSYKQFGKDRSIARVLSDIVSYGIKFKDE